MSDKRHAQMVEDLASKAEHGQGISEVLNQIPFDERLKLAQEITRANAKHTAADASLPQLTISTQEDSSGAEHLTALKNSDGKNAYSLPKSAQGELLDFVIDTSMDRDTQDSKHLQHLSEQEKSGKFYSGTGSREK